MIEFNRKIFLIKKTPVFIFKIENFFDINFYLDIKKLFNKISPDQLSLEENFGKKSIKNGGGHRKYSMKMKIREKYFKS